MAKSRTQKFRRFKDLLRSRTLKNCIRTVCYCVLQSLHHYKAILANLTGR